jgi:hypothetical protein
LNAARAPCGLALAGPEPTILLHNILLTVVVFSLACNREGC